MHLLQIEHPISDFDTWKGVFDSFADFRQQSGVRRHRVLQPTDDPNYVMIDLEFDSAGEAEAFLAALHRDVWSSREASPALVGGPQTRIVEVVEAKEY
jgi:heme-degrading monooxygenase HmoA